MTNEKNHNIILAAKIKALLGEEATQDRPLHSNVQSMMISKGFRACDLHDGVMAWVGMAGSTCMAVLSTDGGLDFSPLDHLFVSFKTTLQGDGEWEDLMELTCGETFEEWSALTKEAGSS